MMTKCNVGKGVKNFDIISDPLHGPLLSKEISWKNNQKYLSNAQNTLKINNFCLPLVKKSLCDSFLGPQDPCRLF